MNVAQSILTIATSQPLVQTFLEPSVARVTKVLMEMAFLATVSNGREVYQQSFLVFGNCLK